MMCVLTVPGLCAPDSLELLNAATPENFSRCQSVAPNQRVVDCGLFRVKHGYHNNEVTCQACSLSVRSHLLFSQPFGILPGHPFAAIPPHQTPLPPGPPNFSTSTNEPPQNHNHPGHSSPFHVLYNQFPAQSRHPTPHQTPAESPFISPRPDDPTPPLRQTRHHTNRSAPRRRNSSSRSSRQHLTSASIQTQDLDALLDETLLKNEELSNERDDLKAENLILLRENAELMQRNAELMRLNAMLRGGRA